MILASATGTGVGEAVKVAEGRGVTVADGMGVIVHVGVGVIVAVGVMVLVGRNVGRLVGVGVGVGATTIRPTLVHPKAKTRRSNRAAVMRRREAASGVCPGVTELSSHSGICIEHAYANSLVVREIQECEKAVDAMVTPFKVITLQKIVEFRSGLRLFPAREENASSFSGNLQVVCFRNRISAPICNIGAIDAIRCTEEFYFCIVDEYTG